MDDPQDKSTVAFPVETRWLIDQSPEKLILCIGDTRLHWGYFINNLLQATWDTARVDRSQIASLLSEFTKNDKFQSIQTDFVTPSPVDLGWADPVQPNDNCLDHTLNKTDLTLDSTDTTPPQTFSQTFSQTSHQISPQTFHQTSQPSPLEKELFPPALMQRLQAVRCVWLASVVPQQTQIWQTALQQRGYQVNQFTLADVPLQATYPSLGIDRALNCVGALWRYRAPCLVVDGGTALTYSAAVQDADQGWRFLGGAILPGLRLQYQALGQQTAQLPWLGTWSSCRSRSVNNVQPIDAVDAVKTLDVIDPVEAIDRPLPRWATETTTAIESGILYTIGAGLAATIADWLHQYPTGQILLTGGDAPLLKTALLLHLKTQVYPGLRLTKDLEEMDQQTVNFASPMQALPILGRENFHIESQLMFLGIQALLSINYQRE